MISQAELGDKLCEYCPLDKKGVYGVPGGFVAGCEGSCCDQAYENYLDEHQESDKKPVFYYNGREVEYINRSLEPGAVYYVIWFSWTDSTVTRTKPRILIKWE